MDENTQNTVSNNQNSNDIQATDFDINNFIGVGDDFTKTAQPEQEQEKGDELPAAVVQTPTTETEVKPETETPTPVPQTTTPSVQPETPVQTQTPPAMPAPVVEQTQPTVVTPLQTGSGFAPNPEELSEILNSTDPSFSQPFNETATDQMPTQTLDQPQTSPVQMDTQPVVQTSPVETEVQQQPFDVATQPTEEISSMGVDMPMEGETTDQSVMGEENTSLMPETQESVQQDTFGMDLPPAVEQPITTTDEMPSNLSQPLPSTSVEEPINNMELIPPTPPHSDEIVNTFGEEKSGKGGTAVVIVLIIVIVALLATIGYFALQIFG